MSIVIQIKAKAPFMQRVYRGRGFWKLSTSSLNDIEYVNWIKLAINQTKAEYVQDDTVNPNLLWD